MVPRHTRLETVETGRWFIMSAPEPSAKPLPHNLDPGGEGGVRLHCQKKRNLESSGCKVIYSITSDYPLPYMRLKVKTFPITRRNFNLAPRLFEIS